MKTNNKLIVRFAVFSIILIISIVSPVLAHSGDDDSGAHSMMDGFYSNMMGGFGMGFFGWIFMLLLIVILILFIVWMIKQIQEPKLKR